MSLNKFFVLLYKRSLSLLNSSKLLIGVILVFQIIVSVAFIVSYTTIFVNRNEDDLATLFKRPFVVTFRTPIREKDIMSKIKGKKEDRIYNSSVFFEATIDKTEVFLEALMYPQNDPTVVGKRITLKDCEDREKKLIASMDTLKYNGLKCYKQGDKVLINNIQFAVIGIRANDFEIPMETGVENFKISSILVHMKNGTDNKDFLAYGQYLKDIFGKNKNAKIIIPPTPQQRTESKLSLHILLGAIMLTTALISFISVFLHIINQSKHEYIILNICGASLKFTVLLMLAQLIFQFTFSYVIAVILIPLINLVISKNSIFLFNLRFEMVSTVYGFSLIAILVISLPHIVKTAKNSIALRKQDNEGERV